MFELERRAFFTTLGELRLLLADYSDDTKVCTCGVWGSYLHIENDGDMISFDDEDLGENYGDDYDWKEKDAKEKDEHYKRCKNLFPKDVFNKVI